MAEPSPQPPGHRERAADSWPIEGDSGAAPTNGNSFGEHQPPLTDPPDNDPESGSDLRLSWYDKGRRDDSEWQFTTQVRYVTGNESQRLRTEMAAVIRELLTWAGEAQAEDEGRSA